MNPQNILAAITSKTKAIIAVDLYGQCADYDGISKIAEAKGISIIEDAAQSLGATYKDRFAGTLGTIACTSFFPSKPLGCYGDGGACFTADMDLAEKIRQIRDHGQSKRYYHDCLGINGRLDTLQAAILLAKLNIFDEELKLRRQVAQLYNEYLSTQIKRPFIEKHNTSTYAQYTIEVSHRERLREFLAESNIPTAIHYPVLMSDQPAIKNICRVEGPLSIAQRASERVLSLPFHPYMSEMDVKQVTQEIHKFYEKQIEKAIL